ncbi:PaaI family thioesterase [Butyrivibrio sp. AC2005]|uniref:PaaI family thioesterase n=1 Tax=Butyrivibrio sp. AC2005 TaxID=1280672 RepID=UPI000423EEAB|nr:PaaI family thioesterase [Butyrivibrio sp. AC2005]
MASTDEFVISRMKNPFMEHNGIEIVSISLEHSVLKATITDKSRNPYGMIHGGLIYTMMDCSAGITARADNNNYVTQNVNVTYLGNVKDRDVIYAEGTVIKRGKSVTVVHSIVRTEEGKLLADGTISMFKLAE